MSPESHTLSLTQRPHAIEQRWNGVCSCAKWRMINCPSKRDIRESHAAHVAERLAPKEVTDAAE